MTTRRFCTILAKAASTSHNRLPVFGFVQFKFILNMLTQKRQGDLDSEILDAIQAVLGLGDSGTTGDMYKSEFSLNAVSKAMQHLDTPRQKYGFTKWLDDNWPSVIYNFKNTEDVEHGIAIIDICSDDSGDGLLADELEDHFDDSPPSPLKRSRSNHEDLPSSLDDQLVADDHDSAFTTPTKSVVIKKRVRTAELLHKLKEWDINMLRVFITRLAKRNELLRTRSARKTLRSPGGTCKTPPVKKHFSKRLQPGVGHAIVLDGHAGKPMVVADTMQQFRVVPTSGKSRLRYSQQSMNAMVLRKSLAGAIGSNGVAAMGGFDMSRQVVCKAEINAAACLALHAQAFHTFENVDGMMVIRTEQDATNTQIWKKNRSS